MMSSPVGHVGDALTIPLFGLETDFMNQGIIYKCLMVKIPLILLLDPRIIGRIFIGLFLARQNNFGDSNGFLKGNHCDQVAKATFVGMFLIASIRKYECAKFHFGGDKGIPSLENVLGL
jgi:hypothetical protein